MVNLSLKSFINLLTLILLLLIAGQSSFADELSASVDRQQLTKNESVTLFLRSPGLQQADEPDLSELYQDFEVLSQQMRTNIRIINGRNQSERIWEIDLMPKHTGTLVIPALSLGSLTSQPLTLEVLPATTNNNSTADVFLHSEIDREDSIYVQQQLVYTLRLYYATSISDHGLTDLKLDDVLMVPLGNRKDFEANIDGRLYNVAEWQFALFPQSSGELVLPPQTFSGRVRARNRYSLGGLKHIRIQSPEHSIQVKPVPEAFPADAQWLPAQSLTLNQQWSDNFRQWQTGNPITRTLTLEANGLTAAQLPPIQMPEQPSLRQYPEPPQLNDLPEQTNRKGAGIRGEKTLSIALIPTQQGQASLPEIRIPWWNTETDQLEYATLDALSLDIQPNPNRQTQMSQTPPDAAPVSTDNITAGNKHLWSISTLISTLTTLVFGLLWWRSQQRIKAMQRCLDSGQTAPPNSVTDHAGYRQALLSACQNNDARAAWDAWQKWHLAASPPVSAAFKQALKALQQHLFGPDTTKEQWSGNDLAAACRQDPKDQRKTDSPLPKLYPD